MSRFGEHPDVLGGAPVALAMMCWSARAATRRTRRAAGDSPRGAATAKGAQDDTVSAAARCGDDRRGRSGNRLLTDPLHGLAATRRRRSSRASSVSSQPGSRPAAGRARSVLTTRRPMFVEDVGARRSSPPPPGRRRWGSGSSPSRCRARAGRWAARRDSPGPPSRGVLATLITPRRLASIQAVARGGSRGAGSRGRVEAASTRHRGGRRSARSAPPTG